MKSIFTSILLLVFAVTASGQNFTLSNLIEMNNLSFDDFDTYVTKKGYTYNSSKKDDEISNVCYISKTRGLDTAYITLEKSKTKNTVTFQINKEQVYLNIKDELKKLGFTYIDRLTLNDVSYLVYKKDDLWLYLSSQFETDVNKLKYTIYSIILESNTSH